jgi:2-succinyl-5-enolpyruvyl-6-hydroxy-3-cyclohexene-1-carboxylate synthase
MTRAPAPEDVQAAFATVLVDEWLRAGVTDAVACPGSRSTPLLVALAEAAERGALRLHVLADERAAGFFALGLGLTSGVPAPVVTTSGTAAAELHPAVVEAHHAAVPLLAVTADRPPELHGFGAPQTVHQVGLFGGAVRWEVDPGPPDLSAAWAWRSLASRAVGEARGAGGRPGPVHLNLAFREPLIGSPANVLQVSPDGTGDDVLEAALGTAGGGDRDRALRLLRAGRADGAPWHDWRQTGLAPPSADVVELVAGTGEQGLIVAGAGAGRPDAVWQLAEATGWPVLATPQSGARVPGAVGAADALLRTGVVRGWRPDVVLRLGASWASRVVNEWLAGLDCTQVLVGPAGAWVAPDRPPGDVVVCSPELLCRAVAERARAAGRHLTGSAWARQWAAAERQAQSAIDAGLAVEAGLTEPGMARSLLAGVPTGSTVLVSSSMPVREVEWWTRPREGVRVLANRGANGIDGVLSTALGVAAWSSSSAGPTRGEVLAGEVPAPPAEAVSGDGRVLALIGDQAFLYDAGVLSAAALSGAAGRSGVDLDVVVFDNDGGGIFSFLPQAANQPAERFERLWGVPHGADLVAVARGYGVPAEELTDVKDIADVASGSHEGRGLRVFVAKTGRAANVEVHHRLNAAVEEAVEGLGW